MATLLLCHADGADGSTVFVDATGTCTLGAVYGAKQSVAQAKFGTASAIFDGGYATLNVSNIPAIGTGDFTVELWFYATGNGNLFDFRGSAGPVVGVNDQNIEIYDPGGIYTNGPSRPSNGAWHHFALVRSNGTMTGYLDGVNIFSGTDTVSMGTSCTFGSAYNNGGTFNGYIDEIRISNTAVYTANFTPPAAAFAAGSSGGGTTPAARRRPLILMAS